MYMMKSKTYLVANAHWYSDLGSRLQMPRPGFDSQSCHTEVFSLRIATDFFP